MIVFDKKELAALEKHLRQLAEKVAKKELRKAARKAMTIVKNDAAANAPEDTGLLEHNFGLTTSVKAGTVKAKVGVKGGAVENPTTPFYFRFNEFGTENQPAKPFMRPALESNAARVFDTMVNELIKGIEQP